MHTPRILTIALTLTLSPLGAGCSDDEVPVTQEFPACEGEFTITAANPMYPWTANAVTLVSEELSSGVFAVYDEAAPTAGPAGFPLATSGGFVIGDDGVLLIETMINRQLFCQLIGLVQEQTDLPVLYAVNTSHHGDHSYGNMFLPAEVEVVQHDETTAFITNAESFAGDIAFMEGVFGADQGIDEITATPADITVDSAGTTLDLGGRSVELRDFGFAQTGGDLFVYVPEANTVWTGNAVVAQSPSIPWLLDGHAVEVRQALVDVRDAYPGAVIVPGHDAPLLISDLDFGISYLDGLMMEVSAQIEMGATLEETVAAVTMESFQGYALFDWVHFVLNVPAAYEELSQ